MSAHQVPIDLDRMFRVGFAKVADPGASGTLGDSNKGLMIFEITTAGAETRVLQAATSFGVGTRIIVFLKKQAGALTITGAEASVVLDAAGDYAEFVVANNDGTHVWRVVSATTAGVAGLGLPADTSDFAKLELSVVPTVQELADALIYLTEQLEAAGVITDVLTQAAK
jgi:hypothetical protein